MTEYIYKRVDLFKNQKGTSINVYERRETLPNGKPNLDGPKEIVARAHYEEEFTVVGSIANAGPLMGGK